MPRRDRRVITYNLNSAAVAAAFDGDDADFELDDAIRSGRSGPAAANPLKARNARSNGSAFADRDHLGSHHGGSIREYRDPQRTQDVLNLFEMFTHIDRGVVEDCYATCHFQFERTLQALMDLSAGMEQATTAAGNDAALDGSALGSGEYDPDRPCLWDLLHESVKELVLSHLSARELARLAWTCRDFAWRVRNGRINARSLIVPGGISLHGVLGMVAGHPNARAVSLVRWGASELGEGDFAALLTAIAQGSCSSRRVVRVEAMSLRGWTHASDGNILQLLESMQHLRELDLSDCCSITDAALGPLSRFTRALPPPPPEGTASGAPAAWATNTAAGTPTAGAPGTPSTTTYTSVLGVGASATPVSVGPGGAPTPSGGMGAHYGVLSRYGSNSFGTPQGVGGAADGYAHAAARRGPRAGGKTGGWDNAGGGATAGSTGAGGGGGGVEDEGEDEELRRAMFESLAMLAGSPTTSALGSLGAIQAAMAGVALGSSGTTGAQGQEGCEAATPAGRGRGTGRRSRRLSGASGGTGGGGGARGDSEVEGGSDSGSEEEEEEEEVLLDEDLAARDAREAGRRVRAAAKRAAGEGGSAPRTPLLGTPTPLSRCTTADDLAPAVAGSHGSIHHAQQPLPTASTHGATHGVPSNLGTSAPRNMSTPASIPRHPGRATHSPFYGASPPTHSPYLTSGPSPSGMNPILGASPPTGASPLMGSSPISRSLGSSAGKAGGMHHVGSFGAKGSFSKLTRAVGQGEGVADGGEGGGEGAGEGGSNGGGGARGLEVLSLAGCSRISSDGVKALLAAPLVKRCLRALDISRCSRITRAALLLPPTASLRVLKAAGCQNLHEVTMQLPLNSPLQELWLNNCKALTKLTLVVPNLLLLHVGGCKSLNRLQLRCGRLTQLLANLCIKLSEVEPEDVVVPRLEALNLFGCRLLGAPDLAALVGRSPALRHLNLNGCLSLGTLELPDNLELRSLDISGCKSLMAARVPSSHLTDVTARACQRLQVMALESPNLKHLDCANCSALQTLSLRALSHAASAVAEQQNQQAAAGSSSSGVAGGAATSSSPAPAWGITAAAPAWHRGSGSISASNPSDLVGPAARSTVRMLAAAGCVAPHVRTAGCESLPQVVTQQLKVLRGAAAIVHAAV